MFAALLTTVGVCLQPVQAQTNGAAKLIQMTGQVSKLLHGAPWVLNVGDEVKPQELIITGPDGSATLRLTDGSTIEVFPNSKFIFRATPTDWQNLLEMYLGMVRVEIQHLAGKPNPNKVRTPTAVISVRGTIFDVSVMDDKGTTLVRVEEGHVEVKNELQPGDGIMLSPGEWVEVDPDQPIAARKPDYNALVQRFGRAFKDVVDEILMHSHAGGGLPGGTSTAADKCTNGGCANGSKGAPPAPPPPPPPPPPQ